MASTTPRLDQLERNLIINGNFDFAQRSPGGAAAASFTAANNVYTFDRFKTSTTGSGTVNVTGSTDVPTLAQSLYNSLTSMKITVGTASASLGASDAYFQRYFVEGYDYAQIHGRKARLQFLAKVVGTNVTGTYSVAMTNGSGNRWITLPYQVPTAGVWTPVYLDISLDTVGTWAFDNSRGLEIDFVYGAGSALVNPANNTWGSTLYIGAAGQTNLMNTSGNSIQFSQVSLIPQDLTQGGAANVIVPFQRAGRSIGHELAMAQRYCEMIQKSTTSAYFAVGLVASTTGAGVLLNYAEKRATPTLTYSAASTFNIFTPSANNVCTSISTQYSDTKSANVTPNSTGMTAGQPAILVSNGSSPATILVDAEL